MGCQAGFLQKFCDFHLRGSRVECEHKEALELERDFPTAASSSFTSSGGCKDCVLPSARQARRPCHAQATRLCRKSQQRPDTIRKRYDWQGHLSDLGTSLLPKKPPKIVQSDYMVPKADCELDALTSAGNGALLAPPGGCLRRVAPVRLLQS